MKQDKAVNEKLLDRIKPESTIMLVLFFIVVGLSGVIVWDYWKKWQIDEDIKSLKTIFTVIAPNLPQDGLPMPMTVPQDYLFEQMPQIAEITFYPNQQIYVQYHGDSQREGDSLLFTFNSFSELHSGKVECIGSSLPNRKRPVQCR